MHGSIGLRERNQLTAPASFPLGKIWGAATVDFAAMTWQGIKFKIEEAVNRLGFETFSPVEEKIIIKRGRKLKVTRAAFGCYLFVRFDREADPWERLRGYDEQDGTGIRGFGKILCNNGIPVRVPDIVIERLQRAAAAGFFGDKPIPIGADVEIMEGPFAGFFGRIRKVSKSHRAHVLLKMLGSIEVDACFLRQT